MNKNALELINKIQNLPIISDMSGYEFNIHLNSNGKGDVWTITYNYKGVDLNKRITLTTEDKFYDTLENLLTALLVELTKNHK